MAITTYATDRVIDRLLQDETALRQLLRPLIQAAAYFTAKAEWDLEDNLAAAEWVHEHMSPFIPDEETIAVFTEGEYELDPEQLEPRLVRYALDQAEDA